MAKKCLLAVIVAVVVAGAASAQVTISGGFALSYMEARAEMTGAGTSPTMKGDIGLGGNVYMDYLLPISIPLSLGLEVGVDSSSLSQGNEKLTVFAIPILARAAYHFDLASALDLYLVGKIGYTVGDIKDNDEPIGGIGFGFDIGVAYYFTPVVGIFAEGGFDMYDMQQKGSESYASGYSYVGGKYTTTYTTVEYTIHVPFYRFFTAGLSLKF